MDHLIESQFQRAEELLSELEDEYGSALDKQEVTNRALNLTHEILMKIRSILDQVMHLYFEKTIAPQLTPNEREKAIIYFPIAESEQSLYSTLGRGKMRQMETDDSKTYHFIRSYQPFVDKRNGWLKILNEYAIAGRHTGLTPQKKKMHKKITVIGPGERASWDPDCVTFFEKETVIMGGAKIDWKTQRIIPMPGVKEIIESWEVFYFEGTHINALKFCEECFEKSKDLVSKFMELIIN